MAERAENASFSVPDRQEESNRYRSPLTDAQWRRIVADLDDGLACVDRQPLERLAQRIRNHLEWLDDPMSRYCGLTCPSCADPCCQGRQIFFNQTDLFCLLLGSVEMPRGQTRTHKDETCRYLGQHGCTLSRFTRPYVCVWFLCEPQMQLFQDEPARFQRQFINALQTIRLDRLRLEAAIENVLFHGR